ncbi:MAG: biotin-dependent carboxyltransferase family protein [Aureibaculum sp.]
MIKVLSPGFYTSIQDLGRFGYGEFGVPVSGAMDQFTAKLANQLLGNNTKEALLEITLGNCKLLFEKQLYICISGADFLPKINGATVILNKVLTVEKDDILTFDRPVFGARCYLAISGGFQTEMVLKSRSYYKGITNVERVQKNDMLPIFEKSRPNPRSLSVVKVNAEHFTTNIIKVYEGPEYNYLNDEQQKRLVNTTFTISKENNRMGYRLNELIVNDLGAIITSSVLPGTVQLTPSGELIVLMRDCQVTGGYPRILQLTENAINILAQKSTGDSFNFRIQPLN